MCNNASPLKHGWLKQERGIQVRGEIGTESIPRQRICRRPVAERNEVV